MESNLSVYEFIVIALLLVFSVAGSCITQLVFTRLEHYHREEWERLGRPNLLRVSSGKSLEMVRFVLTRRYAHLKDRKLNLLIALSIGNGVIIVGQMIFIGCWL